MRAYFRAFSIRTIRRRRSFSVAQPTFPPHSFNVRSKIISRRRPEPVSRAVRIVSNGVFRRRDVVEMSITKTNKKKNRNEYTRAHDRTSAAETDLPRSVGRRVITRTIDPAPLVRRLFRETYSCNRRKSRARVFFIIPPSIFTSSTISRRY